MYKYIYIYIYIYIYSKYIYKYIYIIYIYILIYIYIYINIIYIYIYVYIPVRTLLIYFRNRHLNTFLRVSTRCPILITDHIFGKKVSLIVSRHKFYQTLVCGARFLFNNHELIEKVNWN